MAHAGQDAMTPPDDAHAARLAQVAATLLTLTDSLARTQALLIATNNEVAALNLLIRKHLSWHTTRMTDKQSWLN